MWGWDGGVWRVCEWTALRLAGCSSAVVFVTGSLNPSVWNFFLIKGKEFKGEGWVRADWKKGAAENSGRDFSATFHSSKVTKVTGISCATTELFTVTFEIRACVCKIIFFVCKTHFALVTLSLSCSHNPTYHSCLWIYGIWEMPGVVCSCLIQSILVTHPFSECSVSLGQQVQLVRRLPDKELKKPPKLQLLHSVL